jgi:hypothetical protein
MKNETKHRTTVISKWTCSLGGMLILALMVPTTAFSQYNNPTPVPLLTAGTYTAFSLYNNPTPVPLLTAGTYGALSNGGMTGTATVNGDVGSSNSAVGVGIAPTGTNWTTVNNAHNLAAQTDLGLALSNALGRATDATVTADALGGQVFHRGVYGGGALDLAGGATLELNGGATDVFIIKAATSLTINIGSTVSLTGGAVWSNVFWYVGSSATIFSGSTFNGIILAVSDITVNAGATQVTAKLLANTGAVTIGSTVLPVELVSFTATANRMNAILHWSTATETNNYGFEIERRQTGNWEEVGFVAGAGSSSSPRYYSYTDNNLSPGGYAYRIKQVNKDGSFSYRGSAEVEIASTPQAFALIQNYPNPFNPSTRIQYSLEKAGVVSLKVYNVLGLEVATLVNGHQEAGSYAVSFNALGLSSGVYFYRLEAGSLNSTKKLILMK